MKNGNPPFFKVDTNLASEGGCQSPTPSTPVSAYVPFTSTENSTPMSPSKEPSSRLPTIATISLAPTTTTTVVTTTTTTTTTFPPLLLKPPPLPRQLDPKEYPLADTPTPPALKRFCFDLNGQPAYIREDEDSEQQIIKLQEALYNMRASSTPTRTVKTSVTSTQQTFNDNYVDTIPSGSGARKRPASPIEPVIDFSVNARHQNSIGTYNKLSRERRSLSPPHKKVRAKSVNSMLEQENELASQRQWMEFTTDFRDNNVNSGITIPRTNTPLSTVQGESSTSIITQQVPAASRPFNTISTSNLGMDTPSTTRSTHSSALPSPSLSPITGVSTSRNTNQFETYFAEHSVRDDVDGDDVTVDEPLSAGINENWNLQQITTTDTSNTPSLWDLNTMLTTFDALPASMKSYMLFQLLRRCPTNTLQYVSNIILPALRKDFVGTLPIELSLHIVRYLDAGSMCRAAQVSKRWRNVIDGDGLTWQRRLKLDGFGVDANEEARAIAENWGLIRPIKSTHNRNRQLDSTNNESGTSSSEERTVVEIDDDDTDNMRVVNEDKESSSDSSGLDMYRNNINDNMAVDIDISDQKNNSIADNNNELQDSITLSPTGTDEPSSSAGTSSLFGKEFITRQDKGKARADDEWNDFRLEPETHHDDDHPYDGDDSDVDAMSQEGSDHIEPSEEKPPLPPSASHPYKAIYRRHFLMKQNWINGRHKHISFQGHANNVVTCLQFDSEKIISGSDDQCINVYETSTGKLLNRLEGHDGGVWALQYVGKTLVSGSTDRTVRVWDLEKGVCTHVFPGHTSTVRCLQIIMPQNVNTNPNEPPIVEPPVPLIVTGSRDSTLKVWQLPNLEKNDSQCQPTIPSSPSDNSQYTDNPYFLRTLQGHSHSVRALAGVGNTLVSGSYDCSVRVWNIMTGECLWRLIGHTQKVYSVVLDAKRKRCMSGSMDGTVKVWSLEDGTIVWTLEGHSSLVGLLDLSHDYLVSAAADSSLRIWNPDDGTCKHVLTTHSGAITCFQHDESKVISGSDGTLRMWDVKTGRQQRDLLTGLSGVWQVKFDERRCVAAVQRNSVTWFDVLDFGVYGIEEDDDLPGGSCTDENGNWVDRRITVGWNVRNFMMDIETFHCSRKRNEEKPPLPPSASHPYKAIYRRHFLMKQNWINGRHKHISFQGHGNNVVTCLQFDSEKIISGSDDQCINVYETSTGKLLNRLEGHDGGVWALQYVGKTLVSGSSDRTVRVWDLEKGVCTHVFPGHTSTVRRLQIIMPQNVNTNPNEPPNVEPPVPLIVTGSRDSTLKVWQLPNLEKNDSQCQPTIPSSSSDNSQYTDNPYFLRTLQGHSHSVRALAGVGNTLVSGSYDCSVRVWNIMTGECLWRLIGHTQKVYSVVLDAKRKRCMSGSMDGTVKVWSLEDGTIVWTLEGHSSLVGLLDLSHDYLVSAAVDSSLRIWNPDDGTCKHVLTHSGAITCFQHDESKVISGSDGTLRMWDVKTGRQQRDLLTGLSGVWQVKFDERRCVAAVQRNYVTWFDVLDFGVYGIEEDDDLPGGSCTDEKW